MRVAMVVLNNLTHDARVQKEAKTLAAAGHEVTVIGLKDENVAERETLSGFQVRRVALRSNHWRLGPLTQLARYVEFTWRAARIAQSQRAEVCHAHAIQALPACWLASRLLRAPLIYDAHEFEQDQDFSTSSRIPTLMRLTWSWPERLFIRAAHTVITVSDSLADALAAAYHISKPLVLRNCPEAVAPGAPSTYLRDHYPIPAGWRIVLYQGILARDRGLVQLMQSAAWLEQVAIVIVGDGGIRAELEAIAHSVASERAAAGHSEASFAEESRVIFAGWHPLTELPAITASADVGVILTQHTCRNNFFSLPNKLFEYMQVGLPVVGCDLPEIARVIREYAVGQVVDSADPRAIAQGINDLLRDPQRYARARANTARAAARYNWTVESQTLVNLYAELAQGRRD